MPRISAFYGISIFIYYKDHLPPHVHAVYGDSEAAIEISAGYVLNGRLPNRAAKLVATWLVTHRAEVMNAWNLAVASQPLVQVPPLI